MSQRFKHAARLTMMSQNLKYMDTSVPIKEELRVKNKFMDKFFNELKERLRHSDHLHWKHTLIMVNFIAIIVKTLFVMLVKLDYETR